MFVDQLKVKIELSAGASSFTVTGGNVKHLALHARPWGFEAEASFWLVSKVAESEDELFATFVKSDVMQASMTLGRTFDEVGEVATSMTWKGLVIEKSVTERAFSEVANEPVLQRRYSIRFADRAAVLWKQHFPSALYVDTSLKDLLDDNKPEGVVLAQAWGSVSEAKHSVLSLGLGGAANLASFYDYVHWLLARENAALYYNGATNAYAIASVKPPGEATSVRREEIATVEALFPETRRSAVNVLNAHANAATKKKEIKNTDGVQGVRRDFVIRSSIAADLDTRATLETARAKPREPEARVTFRTYPAVPFVPSMKVSFEEGWSTNVYQHGKTYRVVLASIEGRAQAQGASDDDEEESNHYELEYTLELELASDPVFHRPPFIAPVWPFHVEGKVVSEVGKAEEGTYQSYRDESTSLELYKVKIPLWDDKKVVVSYEPALLTGHFYFPVYKDARVLVALDFDSARVVEFLDWRPGARLPLETQGNHILVGKGATNETSIKHAYEDAKPALTIQRSSSKDQQVIKVSEGTIRFETKDTE